MGDVDVLGGGVGEEVIGYFCKEKGINGYFFVCFG